MMMLLNIMTCNSPALVWISRLLSITLSREFKHTQKRGTFSHKTSGAVLLQDFHTASCMQSSLM